MFVTKPLRSINCPLSFGDPKISSTFHVTRAFPMGWRTASSKLMYNLIDRATVVANQLSIDR